jgi:hypothetical protein
MPLSTVYTFEKKALIPMKSEKAGHPLLDSQNTLHLHTNVCHGKENCIERQRSYRTLPEKSLPIFV